MTNHRDRKLLNLAHDVNECLFQLPGICQGYAPEGCEPAHSNELRHGKGRGLKADDFRHTAACHACHYEYDFGTVFNRQEKSDFFREGWERTIAYYFTQEWIKV